MLLLGDQVTCFREVGGDTSFVTGRVTGIVQNDSGDLKYFYIKGIEAAFWVSDGWTFEYEEETGEEDNA
jgi:hypothetical protein